MISASIEGVDQIVLKLDGLKSSMVRRWARTGITKACRIAAREAKRRCPVETGALKSSIGFVVRTYPKGQPTIVVGVIGPRRDTQKSIAAAGGKVKFKYAIVRNKRGRLRKRTKREAKAGKLPSQWRTPANYAHLVERGHRIAVGGTLGNRIYAPTKGYHYSQYLGRNSKYRKLRKMGIGYWKPFGVRGGGQQGFQKEVEWAKAFAPSTVAAKTTSGMVKPYPFMRPAFDANKATMERLIREAVAAGLAKFGTQVESEAG